MRDDEIRELRDVVYGMHELHTEHLETRTPSGHQLRLARSRHAATRFTRFSARFTQGTQSGISLAKRAQSQVTEEMVRFSFKKVIF